MPGSNPSPSSPQATELKPRSQDVNDPWETCNTYIKKHTGELCESWRDEVDKLLIFAGLFSGVVTGFAIESYHSVKEDPGETTVLLLRTIVLQLDNMTNPQPVPINLNPRLDTITASAKRINTFWFLSLSLSLSTVMAGILCLQWIREYERNANVSHREDVALHHMRREGLKKWRVFKILSALPLLLITAFLLFFSGFIELLWEVDLMAVILVTIVVGAGFLFIFLMTILPTVQCLYLCLSPQAQFTQCPYKSPQAWVMQRCALLTSHSVHKIWRKLMNISSNKPSLLSELFQAQSWPDFDIVLRRCRDANKKKPNLRDVGCSLAWVGETFVQHQELVEAVSTCLRDLDPDVALESSLARMNTHRAEKVRPSVVLLKRAGSTVEGRRNSKFGTAQDLIVSQALEHLAERIEQDHMSPTLLHRRLELFCRINEGERAGPVGGEVDCPINRKNVSLISLDERLRILRCIGAMFERNQRCNSTHTHSAFEILFSLLTDLPGDETVLQITRKTLVELLSWVKQDVETDPRSGMPEGRLKQSTAFVKLILACRGRSDRNIVNEFRQGLDDHIRAFFQAELEKLESPMQNPQYPFLAKYVMSRTSV